MTDTEKQIHLIGLVFLFIAGPGLMIGFTILNLYLGISGLFQ